MSDVKPTGRPSTGNLTAPATSKAKITSTATPSSPPKVGSRPAPRVNPTFVPTSATYHQALHKAGYITDAQLAAAKSGDPTAMEKADKEAFLLASLTSRRTLTQRQATNIDGSDGTEETEGPGTAFLEKQRKRDKSLKENYTKKGYTFVPAGSKNHNCLITSLLQHGTNDYTTNHDSKTAAYRKSLNTKLKQKLTQEQKKRFWDNDLLDADNIDWLLKKMAKDPTLTNKDLSVEVWTANDEGEPISLTFGEGKTRVILFNSTDHFEAVRPPSQLDEKNGVRKLAPATTTATSTTTTKTSRKGS